VFEVIVIVVSPPVAAMSMVNGDTVSVASPAAWVTVTVCEVTPLPETVTVSERAEAVGLACAVTVTVPLPVPFVGLTESQL